MIALSALSRAHFKAIRLASEPPLASVPKLCLPYPIRSHSQRITRASIIADVGPLRHAPAFWLSNADNASAQTPIGNGVGLNCPKYFGLGTPIALGSMCS